MNIKQIKKTLLLIDFKDYTFDAIVDGRGEMYLRASYYEADVATPLGPAELQQTRRWLISPKMTKSEIVQTVFKCALTSMEHRTREWFLYKNRAIFGPHFDVDQLHSWVCVNPKDTRGDR